MTTLLRSDFNFDLPHELIADFPSEQRTACRMLCLDGNSGKLEDKIFIDLKQFLRPGDLLVFNDTRVIPARMYGHKDTGGKCEFLIERILNPQQALAHIKASKSPKPGSTVFVGTEDDPQRYRLTISGRQGALFHVTCQDNQEILSILNDIGHIPLPPYIERPDETMDRERYQTVYSREPGAVAAPTAGLHFDNEQLEDLRAFGVDMAFVTLHVGAGTFQPVREDDILRHHMHAEYVQLSREVADKVISTHKNGGRVIAVGTTAVRSIESAANNALKMGLDEEIAPFNDDTSIFIYPGYQYKVVDCLITNFHLPESTLIMLVCAFAGYANTMNAYRHAVQSKYKFFSYGDCMFIHKRTGPVDLPPSADGDVDSAVCSVQGQDA